MKVYILLHDDAAYGCECTYIRELYADRETAEANLVSRTPSGAKSRALDAHDESCCRVDEWDVEGSAK